MCFKLKCWIIFASVKTACSGRIMRRWKTWESLSVEDYFDEITQPTRWNSFETLDKMSLNDGGLKLAQKSTSNQNVISDPSALCSVCKQRFHRPRFLRCLHSFCKSCIESLAGKTSGEAERTVVCPICSFPSKLGSKGIEELPVNFLILKNPSYVVEERKSPIKCGNCEDNSEATGQCSECKEYLCDKCTAAHRRVRVTRDHQIIPLSELGKENDDNNNVWNPDNCSEHNREEVTYFCSTCNKPICRECTVVSHPKTTHSFEPLKDASNKHRQEITALLDTIKLRTPLVRRALLEIEEACEDIPQHTIAIEEQIRSSTARYIRALKQREEQLLDDLRAMREYKATLLEQQKERLYKGFKDIESNCGLVEKLLQEGNAAEVARVKDFMTGRLRGLTSMIQDISPSEGPEFDYVTEEDLLFDVISRGGKLESRTRPPAVRLIGEGLYNAAVGKTSSFVLAVREDASINKANLDVRIETPDLVILTCVINEHSSKIFTLSYTPRIHGEHVITVLVNEEHVEESPYTVNVKKGHMCFATKLLPVCLRFGYRGKGRGEFRNPSDVAVASNGVIAVADSLNDRIELFTSKGGFMRQFGGSGDEAGRFSSPTGLCFSQSGQIVVADQQNNRVQVFSVDGLLCKVIQNNGRNGGSFKNPTGVAVDEEGQLLVTDQQNHRVVICNNLGVYCNQFGSLGTKDGEFNNPSYIAITQEGEILVTDTSNHRVQIFDSMGKFQRKFGRPGTGDGEFHYPSGITVDSSGYIFVSDRTNRVQVFNSHLRFVTKFGGKISGDGQLSNPQGIDYTPEGRIVVADTGNNSVKVFYFPNE